MPGGGKPTANRRPPTRRKKDVPKRTHVAASPAPPAPFIPVAVAPHRPYAPIDAGFPLARRVGYPLAIFLFALLFIGTHLEQPPQVVTLDEKHYVRFSREIAADRILRDANTTHFELENVPINYEHPPLAKHLIARSLQLHDAGQLDLTWNQYFDGCDAAETTSDPCPAGRDWPGCATMQPECAPEARAWRFPSLLLGAGGVAATYLLALRLFRSVPAGFLAAGLLLFDNLWYLQSRVAMLDIFSSSFSLWALALALGAGPLSWILSGLAMGAAVASKLPALFVLPFFLLFLYLRLPLRTPARRAAATAFLGLGLPLVIYFLTYDSYFVSWIRIDGIGYALGQFILTQGAAVTTDYGFTFHHDYSSPPWSWIPQFIPTLYMCGDGCGHPPTIYAVGNLLIWWPAAAAVLAIPTVILWRRWRAGRFWPRGEALRTLRHRRLVTGTPAALLFPIALFLGTYLPWFLLTRTQLNYYLTLNVPYLSILMAGLLPYAWRRGRRWRYAVVAYLALVAAWFSLWWPIATAADVPKLYFDFLWNLLPWMSK